MAKSQTGERPRMTEKVLIVTQPDDVILDGFRLLLVDLDSEQMKIISDVLLEIKSSATVITYMWGSNDDSYWLLDKKAKSNLIIFNANSQNELIVGYIAAQKNSHYFGTLKTLAQANAKAIYASEDCKSLITLNLNNYE
jgi:hypothetical protein